MLIYVLWRWKPPVMANSLPRESLGPAIAAGLRYVAMSPNIEKVLLRSFIFGFTAISVLALLPLVARDILAGDALLYGVLFGAFGAGAVGGGLVSGLLRRKLARMDCPTVVYRLCRLCCRNSIKLISLADMCRPDGRRCELGGHTVSLEYLCAVIDTALGGRACAFAFPYGCFRWDGTRKLGLGYRCG